LLLEGLVGANKYGGLDAHPEIAIAERLKKQHKKVNFIQCTAVCGQKKSMP